MIKKLKTKFIIISMSLVSVVLIAVFTSLSVVSYFNFRNDCFSALEKVVSYASIEHNGKLTPFSKPFTGDKDGLRMPLILPVFCVEISDQGSVVQTLKFNSDVTDELAEEIVKTIDMDDKESGYLGEYSLIYQIKRDDDKTILAFADVSNELNSLIRHIVLYSTLLIISLLIFFLITYYLSSKAVQPIITAWEKQKRFVSDASHELKTPLTIILANLNILSSHKNKKLSDQEQWLVSTQEEAMRMKELIDDLLYLAKSDEQTVLPVYNIENLSDMVWKSILTFEAVAIEKNIVLNSSVEPNIFVKCDGQSIERLLNILIDNALKYAGNKGTVTVKLNKSGKKVYLVVNNTGKVIPPEDLPNIFERFYRADKSRDANSPGYGLGLSIAKAIAKLHNADITATSTEKDGTSFKIVFTL